MAVSPLYQHAKEVRVQFKLEASSNRDLNVDTLDAGLNRRGRRFPFASQFVTDPAKVDEAAHTYLCDKIIDSLFDGVDGSEYALALFHLLAPYAQQYYERGLQLPEECKAGFAEALADADMWTDFFETHVQRGSAAGSVRSFALKKHIEARVAQHFRDHAFKWSEVKQEFEKRGYVYDGKKDTHVGGVRCKGAFRDCRLLEDDRADNGFHNGAEGAEGGGAEGAEGAEGGAD
jgi:hypothetical protein